MKKMFPIFNYILMSFNESLMDIYCIKKAKQKTFHTYSSARLSSNRCPSFPKGCFPSSCSASNFQSEKDNLVCAGGSLASLL